MRSKLPKASNSHVQPVHESSVEHTPRVTASLVRPPAWVNGLPLQPKLTVNEPGDLYEQEADAMAEKIMRMPAPGSTGKRLQRCACGGTAGPDGECKACKARRLALQRKGDSMGGSEAPQSVHQTLNRPGQPLDDSTRDFMESRFGTDFSGVRVHTDSQAAQSAGDVSALAYTVGSDVVFGSGQYAPGTEGGKSLLAHELTHVVQQSASDEIRLSSLQRDDTDKERITKLNNDYAASVLMADWERAAILLNGFSDTDIENKLLQLTSENRFLLRNAALRAMPGWSDRVVSKIEKIESQAKSESGTKADSGLATGGLTANSMIQTYDATIRISNYVEPAKQLASKLLEDWQSGRIPDMEARELAVSGRNQILTDARTKMSPGGRAFSSAIKEEGKMLSELEIKYAQKVLQQNPTKFAGKPIAEIARSAEVTEEIIRAAGRTSKIVTGVAKFTKVAGPVGIAFGAGISTYEIATAPEGEKLYVAGREASGFTGGMLGAVGGGLVAGWTASLLCGPGAPICALVVSVVVVGGASYMGGAAGEGIYKGVVGSSSDIPPYDYKTPAKNLGMGLYMLPDGSLRKGMTEFF